MKGLILTAPQSGSGKTLITLGLLRALKNRGISIRSAKSGPDYIDPRFHTAAGGSECVNLDAWAMAPARIQDLASGPDDTTLLIEGAMGLFDGAPPDGKGSTADLAQILNLPCVLICDVSKQAQSIAAVVKGFANHVADVNIAGIILNRVGSLRHENMLRKALEPIDIPILGAVYRNANLALPERHLGLVQAEEHTALDFFLSKSAQIIEKSINFDLFLSLFKYFKQTLNATPTLPPPAQSIAVAADTAFAFAYPHLLSAWKTAGAEISFFSPLADQAPSPADLVILPGGYPELYAGTLAANHTFLSGLRKAKAVYGECGGYMVMGDGLIDADGHRHAMLGLLQLETSFAQRTLHLGYRRLLPKGGSWSMPLNGHEFHYATTLKAKGAPLFEVSDTEGVQLPPMGLIQGPHMGSFAHIIDRAD